MTTEWDYSHPFSPRAVLSLHYSGPIFAEDPQVFAPAAPKRRPRSRKWDHVHAAQEENMAKNRIRGSVQREWSEFIDSMHGHKDWDEE